MCTQQNQINSEHKQNPKELDTELDWPEPDAAFSHHITSLYDLNKKTKER